MKRRSFLKFSSTGIASATLGATGLMSWSPRSHAATISKTFYINDGLITQPDNIDVYFKGFSSTSASLRVPGEAMIVQEGDTINITIENTLGTDHSFVIDGLVDSGVIAGGTTKIVSFTANKVGSFMFYDKLNAPYNRILGLHGSFAVMPMGSSNELYAGSPTFTQQYSWLVNEIDATWHTAVKNGSTPTTAFDPHYFTINGRSMRVPGHPDYANPAIDSGYAKDTRLVGTIGDRSLVRIQNAGLLRHAVHFHANHVEWLATNGAVRNDVWLKDTVPLAGNKGSTDVIYPFDAPPDAYPPVGAGEHYPMHLHDEMTQTAGGGYYQFGIATTIEFA